MSTSVNALLTQLKESPESVEFNEVIDCINANYDYSPTYFENGVGDNKAINEAGTNEGSCKIFAFAKLNTLNEKQTLNCFGYYYREDVLLHPDNTDHGNIRNFMDSGWGGITFSSEALK